MNGSPRKFEICLGDIQRFKIIIEDTKCKPDKFLDKPAKKAHNKTWEKIFLYLKLVIE